MAVDIVKLSRKQFLKDHPRLYRFTTIERVLEQLTSNEIKFANPNKWTDPFEKFFLEREYVVGEQKVHLPIRNNAFCLCLSGTVSSEAYWQVYAPKEDGIRLTINTEKFLNLLDNLNQCDVYVGEVVYQITKEFHKIRFNKAALIDEIDKKIVGPQQINLLLKKRQSFLYEDEVRIIIVPNRVKETTYFDAQIEIKSIASEFLLDPRMKKNQVKMIKDYFLDRFSIKVWQSTLYKDIPRGSISLNNPPLFDMKN